ncbi:MAG: ADP-dependent NAD(P)H-hydrate dehydratase / NAD(P)H-hydrate epimerase [Solirubrobacteraceae bacterium]|nr:ADP-dependent NAD(P)H-hydrate dehydratase / NAD(P)H-hydrate epimerase [Solirubrobacteraceae bacterium]
MTLPDWLAGLPDAERMRATDRWAIEEGGISGLELMERAGAGLAALTAQVAGDGPVAVVCGKGNNGGDGYVAARVLREAGRDVRVLAATPVEDLRGDALEHARRLPGPPPEPFSPAALQDAAVAVDALLGTGFSGVPHGPAAEAIEALDAWGGPVVAADVPSGVDAGTGEVAGAAVRAVATATFVAAKPGLWINPGKGLAGEVRVIDIGIPAGAPVPAPDVGLIRDAPVLALVPRRRPGWTKFTSGHVLVAGGARGLSGAPCMAAEAAQRAGAGYVTACVPASVQLVLEIRLLEAMTRGLPDDDGAHTEAGVDTVLELAQRGGALIAGPGLGRTDGAVAFVRRLVREAEVAVVLDADGLNAHAEDLGALAGRRAPTVLTPHEGELGRLLGVDSADVQARRLRHARAAARASGAIVVLKGDDTLVVEPGGMAAVSSGASAALATAGTGDVLSGVIAAVLARGVEPFAAACAGVRLHARAGVRAAAERGVDGVIARDVIEALPHAW